MTTNTPNPANTLEPLDARSSGVVALRGAIFLAMLAWLLVTSAYHAAVTPDGKVTGIDFGIFYHAAGRLNAGLPLYQPHGELYAYSPLLALLMRPLAHLPLDAALKVWFGFSAACLVASVAVFGRAARLGWRDAGPLGLMLLVGFRFWPTTMNFALGQVNFLLLLLLCGMFWADSRRKPLLLGVLLGVAGLFKIWMLGLLLYPLLRRQWRAAAVCLAVCGLSFLVLFSIVGWQEFSPFLQAGLNTGRQVSRISITHSLLGFATLHFRANGLVQPVWDSALVWGLVLLAGTVAIAWGFTLLWQRGSLSPVEARLFLSLVAVSVLLLLPPCQNEYLVLCLPLLWTLLAPADADAGRFSPWMLAGGGLAYLLFSRGWGPYAPVPAPYQHGLRSLLVSAGFYGAAVLWLTGVWALRAMRKPRAPLAEHAGVGARDRLPAPTQVSGERA